jgi:ribosomal protein L37E
MAKLKHPNFLSKDSKWYLVRCPKCDKENYAPMVASGVCAWCAFDGNKKRGNKK